MHEKENDRLLSTLENSQALADEGLKVLKLVYECAEDDYNGTSEKDLAELVIMYRHFPYLLATLQLAIDRNEGINGAMGTEVETTYRAHRESKEGVLCNG